MPYLILLALALGGAAAGLVSDAAYFMIWLVTIVPMMMLIFGRRARPINQAFWFSTACVVNFTVSCGHNIADGRQGWAIAMGVFALYWLWCTMSVASKMDGLGDNRPYNRYED